METNANEPTVSTANQPGEAIQGGLRPPQHWTEQPLPDGDADSALGEDAASSTTSIASSILHYRSLNGRTYHSEREGAHYWGPNDAKQNNVLDIGHHVYTLAIDGKLHLAPLPDHVEKVIDIGTGTGIWAIDFADAHPDAKVIGTDLSPIQPTWVPPNVFFQIEHFSEPWLFEEGSVDFVHTRWLSGCVSDWTVLLQNAYRVLKPGGWFESFDFDGTMTSDDGSVPENSALGQWCYIMQEGVRKLGSTASFTPCKEALVRKGAEAAGFVNIHETHYKVPPCEWSADPKLREIGLYSRFGLEDDTEGFVGYMATQLGWTKEAISMYAVHLRQELRSLKLHAYYHGLVVYAQKPLDA